MLFCFFFFNVTETTEISTLSLHDALPISEIVYSAAKKGDGLANEIVRDTARYLGAGMATLLNVRSEEHTSELQSPDQLVCRLLLEKKKRSCSSRGSR